MGEFTKLDIASDTGKFELNLYDFGKNISGCTEDKDCINFFGLQGYKWSCKHADYYDTLFYQLTLLQPAIGYRFKQVVMNVAYRVGEYALNTHRTRAYSAKVLAGIKPVGWLAIGVQHSLLLSKSIWTTKTSEYDANEFGVSVLHKNFVAGINLTLKHDKEYYKNSERKELGVQNIIKFGGLKVGAVGFVTFKKDYTELPGDTSETCVFMHFVIHTIYSVKNHNKKFNIGIKFYRISTAIDTFFEYWACKMTLPGCRFGYGVGLHYFSNYVNVGIELTTEHRKIYYYDTTKTNRYSIRVGGEVNPIKYVNLALGYIWERGAEEEFFEFCTENRAIVFGIRLRFAGFEQVVALRRSYQYMLFEIGQPAQEFLEVFFDCQYKF